MSYLFIPSISQSTTTTRDTVMSFNAAVAVLGPIVGSMALAGLITCCLLGGKTQAEKKVCELFKHAEGFVANRISAGRESQTRTLAQKFESIQQDFDKFKDIPKLAEAVIDEIGPVNEHEQSTERQRVMRLMHLAASKLPAQFYAMVATAIESIKKEGARSDKRAEFEAIKAPLNELKKKVVDSYEKHMTSEDTKLDDGSLDEKLNAIIKKYDGDAAVQEIINA